MRNITLNNPAKFITQPEVSFTVSEVTVERVTDTGTSVDAIVLFANGEGKTVTLWNASTSPTYEGIGQWTDNDVDERLKVIL